MTPMERDSRKAVEEEGFAWGPDTIETEIRERILAVRVEARGDENELRPEARERREPLALHRRAKSLSIGHRRKRHGV